VKFSPKKFGDFSALVEQFEYPFTLQMPVWLPESVLLKGL
jgi:hypothetical protein